MGSSEIYRIVEGLPEVLDSLIVGVELPHGRYYMPLFVVLKDGIVLDDALIAKIKGRLRSGISPHHVPDEIFAIAAVPRTLSGKKLEGAGEKLFIGGPGEEGIRKGAVRKPQ